MQYVTVVLMLGPTLMHAALCSYPFTHPRTHRQVTTLAGDGTENSEDGTGTAASIHGPTDVATTSDGSVIYVAELSGRRIRKIIAATGVSSW